MLKLPLSYTKNYMETQIKSLIISTNLHFFVKFIYICCYRSLWAPRNTSGEMIWALSETSSVLLAACRLGFFTHCESQIAMGALRKKLQ